MNNDYEDFTSDEEDEEVLEQYEDEDDDEEEIIEDEENVEDIEEVVEEEEEVVEEEEEVIEEDNDGDEDKSLIDEIFDDKHPQQYSRKREFKIDKEKILNQINKFKFKSFEDGRENMRKELYNFTPSDKNVNVFLNNIKGNGWNILRNMFYNTLSLKEILGEIKEEKYQYESILWDKFREIIKKEVISLQTEIEVIDSFISCPKCKQKKIQFYNVQLRRADEPPTTFNNCMNKDCLYSWRTG